MNEAARSMLNRALALIAHFHRNPLTMFQQEVDERIRWVVHSPNYIPLLGCMPSLEERIANVAAELSPDGDAKRIVGESTRWFKQDVIPAIRWLAELAKNLPSTAEEIPRCSASVHFGGTNSAGNNGHARMRWIPSILTKRRATPTTMASAAINRALRLFVYAFNNPYLCFGPDGDPRTLADDAWSDDNPILNLKDRLSTEAERLERIRRRHMLYQGYRLDAAQISELYTKDELWLALLEDHRLVGSPEVVLGKKRTETEQEVRLKLLVKKYGYQEKPYSGRRRASVLKRGKDFVVIDPSCEAWGTQDGVKNFRACKEFIAKFADNPVRYMIEALGYKDEAPGAANVRLSKNKDWLMSNNGGQTYSGSKQGLADWVTAQKMSKAENAHLNTLTYLKTTTSYAILPREKLTQILVHENEAVVQLRNGTLLFTSGSERHFDEIPDDDPELNRRLVKRLATLHSLFKDPRFKPDRREQYISPEHFVVVHDDGSIFGTEGGKDALEEATEAARRIDAEAKAWLAERFAPILEWFADSLAAKREQAASKHKQAS